MGKTNKPSAVDPEIAAMSKVITSLQDLDQAAQQRVINYAITRLNLVARRDEQLDLESQGEREDEHNRDNEPSAPTPATPPHEEPDGLEGINSVAKKWMSRNALTSEALSKLFSLGIDEIDLVAEKVPGGNKRDRMRSVILLKAVASYLSSGAARVTHEQVKETCLHYDAFDTDNFAKYLKGMIAEVGGTKEAGYTLTPRGLTKATELIKSMVGTPAK
jgi:hypothetical protein